MLFDDQYTERVGAFGGVGCELFEGVSTRELQVGTPTEVVCSLDSRCCKAEGFGASPGIGADTATTDKEATNTEGVGTADKACCDLYEASWTAW